MIKFRKLFGKMQNFRPIKLPSSDARMKQAKIEALFHNNFSSKSATFANCREKTQPQSRIWNGAAGTWKIREIADNDGIKRIKIAILRNIFPF